MKNLQLKTYNLQHFQKSCLGKVLLLVITCWLLVLPIFVFADTTGPQDFIYLFHLYYDNGNLVADRDFEFKYDVIPETFVPETLTTQFPYKGKVINLKGEVAGTFQFDPRHNNPKFLKGKMLVKAPYVPDGQKVVFYDSQGDALLTIFVSESSFCNDDGICNPDVGEDTKTCPNDCKVSEVINNPQLTTSNNASGSGVVKGIIYLIIGLGIVGGWFGRKWWQKKKQSLATEIPSNLPPSASSNPL